MTDYQKQVEDEARIMARVMGSRGATARIEKRDEDGKIVVLAEATYRRPPVRKTFKLSTYATGGVSSTFARDVDDNETVVTVGVEDGIVTVRVRDYSSHPVEVIHETSDLDDDSLFEDYKGLI